MFLILLIATSQRGEYVQFHDFNRLIYDIAIDAICHLHYIYILQNY